MIYIFPPITSNPVTQGRDPGRAPFMTCHTRSASIGRAPPKTTHRRAIFIHRASLRPFHIWCSLVHWEPSPNMNRTFHPFYYTEKVGKRECLLSRPLTRRSMSSVQTELRPSSQNRPRLILYIGEKPSTCPTSVANH